MTLGSLQATSTTATSSFAGGITGPGNFTILQNGNVGVGTGNPFYLLDVNSSTSGGAVTQVKNPTAGAGNYAAARVTSDDHAMDLVSLSSTWTTRGWNVQSGSTVGASGSGGLSIGASAPTGVLRLYTGGQLDANERMRITSDGNVGIGTTSPATKLDVNGAINTTDELLFNQGTYGKLTWHGGSDFDIRAGAGYKLYLGANNQPGKVAIDTSGNVGIGTTSPKAKLNVHGSLSSPTAFANGSAGQIHITGSETTTGNFAKLTFNNSYSDNTGTLAEAGIGALFTGAGSSLYFGTSNSYASGITNTAMVIDGSGNVGIGTTSPATTLEVASANEGIAKFSRTTAADAKISFNAAGLNKYFVGYDADNSGNFEIDDSNASPLVSVTTTGNVGIGTTTPGAKLDVKDGIIRALDNNGAYPTTGGAGTELLYAGGSGYLQSYNRGTSAYTPLILRGSTAQLYAGTTGGIDVNATGNVGINCTDPDHLLELGGTGTGCNTGTGSYISAGSTAFTANSSREWKENIATVTMPDILGRIAATPLRSYDFKPAFCTGNDCANKIGWIAEEFFPVLQHGDDKHVSGQDVEAALWLGVQALIAKVSDLANTLASFADHFTTRELTFTRATGDEIDVKRTTTDTLCVRDTAGATCITRAQLDALLQQAGQSPAAAPTVPTPASPTTGDQPADVTVTGSSAPPVIDSPPLAPEALPTIPDAPPIAP